MKKLLLIFLITSGMFLLIQCSEESNSMSSYNNENYFSLFFSNMIAGFWTSDISEIPTVTINGVNMELFWPHGRKIEGWMYGLQHNDTTNYVISGSGKMTVGSIVFSAPYNVSCNGILLEEFGTNYIPSSNSFNFSWSCKSYDVFLIYWDTNHVHRNEITTNTTITFSNDGSNHYFIQIISHKGVLLNSESKPNVVSDYGLGYVFADYEKNYNLNLSTLSTQE